MYCQNCGSFLAQDTRFCASCGRQQIPPPVPVATAASPPVPVHATAQPQKRSGSQLLWLFTAGMVVTLVILGLIGGSSKEQSTSTVSQSSESSAALQQQNIRSSTPPPKFKIYGDDDGMVSIVVPVGTTDEQLKSLLWLFREKVKSHHLADIGLKDRRDGAFLVYRGKKCAAEQIHITASTGPCGDGYHDDALYQWGIEGDYNKDSGSMRNVVVFDYNDGRQTP